MAPLTGKVVIVTGASSGFGAAAARLFAREGCKVYSPHAGLTASMSWQKKYVMPAERHLPAKPMSACCLKSIDGPITLLTYGRIDILFNNAGFGRLDWFEKPSIRSGI